MNKLGLETPQTPWIIHHLEQGVYLALQENPMLYYSQKRVPQRSLTKKKRLRERGLKGGTLYS